MEEGEEKLENGSVSQWREIVYESCVWQVRGLSSIGSGSRMRL